MFSISTISKFKDKYFNFGGEEMAFIFVTESLESKWFGPMPSRVLYSAMKASKHNCEKSRFCHIVQWALLIDFLISYINDFSRIFICAAKPVLKYFKH